MKSFCLLLAVLIIGSNAFSKTTIPAAATAGQELLKESPTNWTDTLPVPENICVAFVTKYPSTTQVKWYQYNPGTVKVEQSDWYYSMDPSDYYVSFIMDNSDYVAWYDNGAWIR